MTTKDYEALGQLVQDMVRGVLTVMDQMNACGKDTAFARHDIAVAGFPTMTLFVAAPGAAKTFEAAACNQYEVATIPMKVGGPQGGGSCKPS